MSHSDPDLARCRRSYGVACVMLFLVLTVGVFGRGNDDLASRFPAGPFVDLNAIAHGNGNFVTVSVNRAAFTSANGIDWTSQPSDSLLDLHGVSFDGGLFVAVGASGSIQTSPFGWDWVLRVPRTESDLFAIAYGVHVYVAVGDDGTTLTSLDAVDWRVEISATVTDLRDVVFGNAPLHPKWPENAHLP